MSIFFHFSVVHLIAPVFHTISFPLGSQKMHSLCFVSSNKYYFSKQLFWEFDFRYLWSGTKVRFTTLLLKFRPQGWKSQFRPASQVPKIRISKEALWNSILHYQRRNTEIANELEDCARAKRGLQQTSCICCVLFRVMYTIFHSNCFENLILGTCEAGRKCGLQAYL